MLKFSNSPEQTLRKSRTASWKKTQEVSFTPLPCDGKWLLPKQNSLSSVPSGTTPLWRYQRLALQQDCWLTEFHGQPQIIKSLKPCLYRGLDGVHHSLYCLPRSYQHNVTHIWALPLPIHPNISQKWTWHNFSWFSWWLNFFNIAFMKLMITILFTNN